MSGEFNIEVSGLAALKDALVNLAPNLRKGPARRALKAGAVPILAKAIESTPQLTRDIYRRGILIRRSGTLRRALAIRNSKDTNRTGDVGVIVNIRPLSKGAIKTFKEATGRRGADNPDDPFYWRWVNFETKRNKNPARFLQKAGDILQSAALPLIVDSLTKYFARLASKASK